MYLVELGPLLLCTMVKRIQGRYFYIGFWVLIISTCFIIILLLQIIADVFNSDVYIIGGTANSACVGGAYRAKHSLMSGGSAFRDAVQEAPAYELVAKPREEAHKVRGVVIACRTRN